MHLEVQNTALCGTVVAAQIAAISTKIKNVSLSNEFLCPLHILYTVLYFENKFHSLYLCTSKVKIIISALPYPKGINIACLKSKNNAIKDQIRPV